MKTSLIAVLMVLFALPLAAQRSEIGFYRNPDQRGLNVFETIQEDTVPYTGLKVRLGGNFTQQFQALSHSNEANPNMVDFRDGQINLNALYPLSNGLNLATANLNFDVQLEDGIRMSLESYMSSRHHSEFWVKGGYIQVDKLPMFGNPQWFTDHVSVKIGHMEVNYGDQHFRRSDNGRTLFNPFVGNTIMDAFTTEIGGEVYVNLTPDFFVMGGMTSGLISGDVKDVGVTKNPSLLAKAGYDSQISDDLRVRLTGSLYTNPGTTRNTLYAGDRAGSRYYMVADPEYYRNYRAGGAITAASADNTFTSGRFNPNFTQQVNAFMVNPFVKFKGLEFFGMYEVASGTQSATAESRQVTQLMGEVVYRFLDREQMYIGARFNQVSGEIGGANGEVSIDRMQLGLGWYTTKNLLVKLEYVNQSYNDFDANDYRHGLKFNGLMIEAAVGF
ncbi:MAG: hypothetical protein R6U64_06825 [Bacteroidales bacterium]